MAHSLQPDFNQPAGPFPLDGLPLLGPPAEDADGHRRDGGGDRLELGSGLVDLLDDQLRGDLCQRSQPWGEALQVAERLLRCRAHEPVAVLEAADQVPPLVPRFAPDRLVVEPAIVDRRHLGAQRRQGGADGADGRPHLRRLAHEVGCRAAEERVVEQAAPPPAADPNGIEGHVAGDGARPVETSHPL